MSGIFDQIINYSPPLIVSGTVNYKGTWNASTNNPPLSNPPVASTKGDYYVVSTAGTQFSISFAVGDWIISSGTAWEKVDLTDAVSSVFGRTGAVVGVSTDYSAVGLTNTAIGASSPSTGAFTTVTASSTIAATGAVTGSNLSGTNTGDQTITLTGGVTGSGTGSFAVTVVTNANLTGAITSVGNATSLGSFSSANLASALTDETGSGANVFATSPTLVTPILGTPQSGTLTSCTGLPISTGVSGLGTGVATALAVNVGSAGAPVVNGGALGTPSSGTVTNLTGTAAININGTVGATTPSTVAATTLTASGQATLSTTLLVGSGATLTGSGVEVQAANFQIIGRSSSTTRMMLAHDGTKGKIGTLDNQSFDFLVNNAIVGTVSSTGLNSTAIGATTPSTAVFTTIHQGTAGAQGLSVGFSGAAGQGFTLRDTTNSRTYFITTETATGLQINAGANPITLLGNTNVTGALSATGRVSTLAGTNVSLTNSRNDNVAIGTAGFFRFLGGGASAEISGMAAGTDGQQITVFNATGSNIVFLYDDANSTAANRIYVDGGVSITLANAGAIAFIYLAVSSRWVFVGKP